MVYKKLPWLGIIYGTVYYKALVIWKIIKKKKIESTHSNNSKTIRKWMYINPKGGWFIFQTYFHVNYIFSMYILTYCFFQQASLDDYCLFVTIEKGRKRKYFLFWVNVDNLSYKKTRALLFFMLDGLISSVVYM